jgi:site-specific DNA recombinase
MPNHQQSTGYYTYRRVSSERQSDGASLDVQLEQMQKYARDEKLEIAKDYVEVESAKESNRPIFNQMVIDLRHSKTKGIIFHKIDRASRNFKDAAQFDDLVKEGYELHFVSDRISSNHPNWRLAAIQFGLAKFYLDNLKQEIEKGTGGMLNKGLRPNPAPMGYLNKGLGVKEPDPIQSKLVKLAFEFYSTGSYDMVKLTKKMQELGLRNTKGRVVNLKSLYKTLRKSFYHGIVTYRGVPYKGSHEPVITKAMFDKVQQVMDGKGFKRIREHYYIFQGLVPCPICGKPLRSVSSKGKYKYHSCRDKQCPFTTVSEPEIEDTFLYELRKLEFDEKEAEVFLKVVKKFRSDLRESQGTDLKVIDMEETKVKQQLDELAMEYFEKKFTDDEHKMLKAKLLNRQQALAERRTALNKADEQICSQMEKIGKLLKRPVIIYQNASDEKKREIVKSLVENFSWGNQNDRKTLAIIWKKEFEIVSKRPKSSSGGPWENRTPTSRMQTERTTTMLKAR